MAAAQANAAHGERLNPVGAGLAVTGAFAAILAIFLPVADAGTVQVRQNSLIQSPNGTGVAVRMVVLAVIVLAVTYRYYRQGFGDWGILIPAAILVIGAFVDARNDDLFTLVGANSVQDILGGTTSTSRADAGIALYVAGVGGALAFAGGLMMWRVGGPAVVPDASAPLRVAPADATKACPDCAETVLAAAHVCRYCGYRFEREGAPAAPPQE